jgi:hypothetical protein
VLVRSTALYSPTYDGIPVSGMVPFKKTACSKYLFGFVVSASVFDLPKIES